MRFVRTWLPVIVWSAVILWASTDSFSSSESRGWLASAVGAELADALNIAIRKLGHVVAYGILGILAWRADRRLVVALSVALIVAVTDESRQSMTRLRTGSAWDVLLDVIAAWLGILLLIRAGMRWPQAQPPRS
jgi:VanZ family protein